MPRYIGVSHLASGHLARYPAAIRADRPELDAGFGYAEVAGLGAEIIVQTSPGLKPKCTSYDYLVSCDDDSLTVRPVRPDEHEAATRVQTIAFVGAGDPDEPELDQDDEAVAKWAAYTDNGQLVACLDAISYNMTFDGHLVKMAGIGSVATLPEHRRGGYVRAIFGKLMPALREQGVLFSYLYPFSHDFYRKFGYELCSNRDFANFPTDQATRFAATGHLEQFQSGDDIAPYLAIHQGFSSHFNLSVVKDEAGLRQALEASSDDRRRYVYLWSNDDGQAKSFLTFIAKGQDFDWTMAIQRFEWLDEAGFQGMVSMLGRFANPYEKCRWHIPPGVSQMAVVGEPWKMEIARTCGGMGRVVDVAPALTLLRPPQGTGQATIKVVDDFCAWNNASHTIEWASGQLSVSPAKQRVDATVPVTTLAQLMCGFTTPDAAKLAGSIDIDANQAGLAQLFPLKPVYITEQF